MADFYSSLSKEALGEDDISDVSDGDLNNILADMDDLDASLFGTPAVKSNTSNKNEPASKPIPIRSGSQPPSSAHQPITSSTPVILSSSSAEKTKGSKSRLLAELFGEETDKDLYQAPTITATIPREIIPSPRQSPERKVETMNVNYLPTSEPRQRRRQPLNSVPSEDLWSKFLQTGNEETADTSKNINKSFETAEKMTPETIFQEEERKFEPSFSPVKATSNIIASSPDKKPSLFENVAPQQPIGVSSLVHISPEEQIKLLKPHIELIIQEYLQKFEESNQKSEERSKELTSQINDLNLSQQKLEKYLEISKEKVAMQQESLETLQEKNAVETRELHHKLRGFESEQQRALALAEDVTRREISSLDLKLSHVQKQLEALEATQVEVQTTSEKTQRDIVRLVEERLINGLETLKSELNQQLQTTQGKVRSLESQLSRVEQQLEEEELRMESVEAKCRQVNSKRSSTWEQDLEFRVEQTENSLESRLNSTNKQHARLAVWQEKQLADLSEYVDQRLWSLYNQLELQRRELVSVGNKFVEQQAAMLEPCVESQLLRKVFNDKDIYQREWQDKYEKKMSELESRMTSTQSETCKLSRLAERLCNVLQMWEQRHKTAMRLEQDTMQSLKERFNMAVIEKSFNNTK